MEAIILAGGKAERLGDAAGGRPKSLVEVGRQAARRLPGRAGSRQAGVTRVIISCAARPGRGCSSGSWPGSGPRSWPPRSPSGSAVAAGSSSQRSVRRETGDVYALNGDELVAVDFGALLARHRAAGGAATVAVAQPKSPFGVVDARRRTT